MQRPLKITSRDFVLTEAIESEIRQKADALDGYYHRISGCEVTVHARPPSSIIARAVHLPWESA